MKTYPEGRYPLQELTGKVIGAAIEVHRLMGKGFTELVYQGAFSIERSLRGIEFASQPEVVVLYKGQEIPHRFRPDFLVSDGLLIEIKAVSGISNIDKAQVMNYLKATRIRLALLLNFGTSTLEIRRIIL